MNNPTTFMQWIETSPFRKNIAVLILTFIALALIVGTVLLYKGVSNYGISENYPQTISVTGKAEEFIKPDTLVFTITANEEGKDVVSASKSVDEKIAAAIKILKDNGVEEKNIKTTSREVNDTYGTVACPAVLPMPGIREVAEPSPGCSTSKVTGVHVYQTVEVKVPNIDKDADGSKREKLFTALTGANIKTGQISFTVYDTDEVKKRVRAEAIKKAKADAKILARDLGVDLKQLQSFGDNGGGSYSYMSARAEAAPMMDAMKVSNAVLPTGEQKIVSEVTLNYLIK
jgi:uncharacterized protein YggE